MNKWREEGRWEPGKVNLLRIRSPERALVQMLRSNHNRLLSTRWLRYPMYVQNAY
ncbi:MAG TPA: hypothetical protein VK543_16925 [Puia sp.]|nr:hypothetical protein [Puia sp.]